MNMTRFCFDYVNFDTTKIQWMTCWKASSNISSKYISGTKSLCEMSWLLTWWLGDFDGFCLWNSPWFPTGRERFTSSDHILRIFAVSTIVPFRLFPEFNRSNLFDVAVSGFMTQYICQVFVPLFDGEKLVWEAKLCCKRIWCWDPYAVLHPEDLAGFQWGSSNKPIQWTHESIFNRPIMIHVVIPSINRLPGCRTPGVFHGKKAPFQSDFPSLLRGWFIPSAAPELPKTKKKTTLEVLIAYIYLYIIYRTNHV